jgi:hypothetical protein
MESMVPPGLVVLLAVMAVMEAIAVALAVLGLIPLVMVETELCLVAAAVVAR